MFCENFGNGWVGPPPSSWIQWYPPSLSSENAYGGGGVRCLGGYGKSCSLGGSDRFFVQSLIVIERNSSVREAMFYCLSPYCFPILYGVFIVFEGFNVLRHMLSVVALLTSSQVLQGLYRSFHYVIMHYFLLELMLFKIRHGFNSSFYALSFQYYWITKM